MPRCETCEAEEVARANVCMAAEDEASRRGEPFECSCGPVPDCTHGKPVACGEETREGTCRLPLGHDGSVDMGEALQGVDPYRAAHEHYAHQMNKKYYDEHEPSWDELSEDERMAWRAGFEMYVKAGGT